MSFCRLPMCFACHQKSGIREIWKSVTQEEQEYKVLTCMYICFCSFPFSLLYSLHMHVLCCHVSMAVAVYSVYQSTNIQQDNSEIFLTLLPPLWLIFKVSIVLCISMLNTLSKLPEENLGCNFWRCSFRELLLKPAFFPQRGHTFIVGRLGCHFMDAFPWTFLSSSNKILPNPSFGCARRWTFLSNFHASERVKFLSKQ